MKRVAPETAKQFARFLESLHSCPASSAGIERWFSTVWFIWSKNREIGLVLKKLKSWLLSTGHSGQKSLSSQYLYNN